MNNCEIARLTLAQFWQDFILALTASSDTLARSKSDIDAMLELGASRGLCMVQIGEFRES